MSSTTVLLTVAALAAAAGYLLALVTGGWPRRNDGAAEVADAVARHLVDERRAEVGASARLDARLEALGSDLGRMTGLMRQLETGRAEQYGDLSRHLEQTMRTTAQLSHTTEQLHRVLADNSARGQWGERMADDVLRAAGLVEGVNYVRQQRLPSGGVPDVTLLLPRGRRLHMDVKFPLASYSAYRAATDAGAAERHRRTFLRDARARIREVSTRDYLDAEDGVGLALLLIPNEAVFAFLQQQDPGAFDDAMTQRVAVCSPLTLFAVLAVVRHAMDTVELAEASEEIRGQLVAVQRQWEAFGRDLDRLGTHLRHATGAADDLIGPRRRAVDTALQAAVPRSRLSGMPPEGPVAGRPDRAAS